MLYVVSDDSHYLKSLNAESRTKGVQENELAEVHKQIGKVLGQKYLDKVPLREITITTPQDKQAVDVTLDCSNVTLVCLMRAGLYVAEGVRQSFRKSAHMFVDSHNPDDLKLELIKGRDVVLVDSVINSGKTLMSYISACSEAASVTTIALVMQDGFRAVIDEQYPELDFIVSRTSANSYVGKGQTDTGNRLFGTC